MKVDISIIGFKVPAYLRGEIGDQGCNVPLEKIPVEEIAKLTRDFVKEVYAKAKKREWNHRPMLVWVRGLHLLGHEASKAYTVHRTVGDIDEAEEYLNEVDDSLDGVSIMRRAAAEFDSGETTFVHRAAVTEVIITLI